MTREAEHHDAEILCAAIISKKQACYSYMESLDRADARQLETSGYKGKTNAEAMQIAFKHYQRDIKKLIEDHFKKYPD